MRRTFALMALVVMLAPIAARAQSKEDMARADAMQTASEKFLLLRGAEPRNATGMPASDFALIVQSIEQLRFNVRTWAPESPDVIAHCKAGAADAAIKSEETDTKGEAQVTMERLLKRCSEIAQHFFTGSHSCVWNSNNSEWDCTVNIEITLKKYTAKDKGDGTFNIVLDDQFGEGGTMVITQSWDSSDSVQETAIATAAFFAKLFAERQVRDIEMFQLRAPVQANIDDYTKFCLGKDSVELDTPFWVLKPVEGGTENVGFVKARELYDGCFLTNELKAKQDKGEKIELRPIEAQNILGGSDIMAGMTAWEMPAIGLNFGVGFATSPYATQNTFTDTIAHSFTPAGALVVEYNLARHIGISEFWVGTTWRFTKAGADFLGDRAIDNAKKLASFFALQIDFNVFKRWYFGGPMFADVGGGITVSEPFGGVGAYYPYAAGGIAKLGLGVQPHGRVLLRLNAGFRYAYSYIDADYSEMGILLGLDVLYNY
jgi:hypothetical protein